MIVLDVNVVVATHRSDHPHHAIVRPWFDQLITGRDRFCVPHIVWASFVRITTYRRIFKLPTPVSDAFAFMRSVRTQPNHEPIAPGERHLAYFEELCAAHAVSGNLVMDAYLAALTIEHGAVLATLDGDFARFSELKTVRPATT